MNNTAILLIGLCLFPSFIFSQIIINEFYADVALGSLGDANGDGVRSAREDEFIELVNPTDTTINLQGYSIWASEVLRHEFDTLLMMQPNTAIVVFGGGNPIGAFGGSPVLIASSGALGLGNSGTKVALRNQNGEVIEEFTYPDQDINTSWTRDPDLTGGFKSHAQVVDAYDTPFSPGTLANSFPFDSGTNTLVHFHNIVGIGSEDMAMIRLPIHLINPSETAATVVTISLADGSKEDIDDFISGDISFLPKEDGLKFLYIPITNDEMVEGVERFTFQIDNLIGGNNASISNNKQYTLQLEDNDFDFPLLLNEIHADPAPGEAGDANGDGFRDAREDEFLEFVNISEEIIDVSNFRVFDSDAIRHIIPEGTLIEPNQAYVLFGGGMPTGDFGNAIVQTASTGGLSLLNEGDKVILKDTNERTVYAYTFGSKAAENQSITRYPDLADGSIDSLHALVGAGRLFSPGRTVEGTLFSMTVSIDEQLLTSSIQIFPNPNNGHFFIDIPTSLWIHHLELVNMQGQIMASIRQPNREVQMELPDGIYWLYLETNFGRIVRKLLVK